MDRAHLRHRHRPRRRLLDAGGHSLGAHLAAVVLRDGVGVVIRGHLVVAGDRVAVGRVADRGQLVGRDEPLPPGAPLRT